MDSIADQSKVAIVIVNWNKKEYLLNILNSLKHIDYNDYDFIVVDNASTDGSVDALRESFPEMNLIINEENLGGAGGFNTGMRYALSENKYKYIWLLDNDAVVEPDTLSELVSVMEEDDNVGIAGSMILNPDNKELIVEVGLHIDWHTGVVKPFMENYRLSDVNPGVYEVDYVAACSALIRVDSLKNTDLMDERYFIWWDDADLGFSIRCGGKKAVGVTKSVVYHPTEKDWILINYYNNRNSLLAFSKFTSFKNRASIFHRIASYSSKAIVFYYLTGNRYKAKILYCSLRDYLLNNWKKLSDDSVAALNNAGLKRTEEFSIAEKPSLLILPTGNFDKISSLIEMMKKRSPDSSITLMIQDYRKNLFENMAIDDFIIYNDKSVYIFFEHIRLFFKLLLKNFDIALTPNADSDSPFGYLAKRYYVYSDKDSTLEFKGTRRDLWKVIFATVTGEIAAIPLTLILLMKSLQYNDGRKLPK